MSNTLKDVMPEEFMNGEYDEDRAMKFADVEVVSEYDGTIKYWIGTHRHVFFWVVLSNGYAVGWNENPSRGWSFPVKKIKT